MAQERESHGRGGYRVAAVDFRIQLIPVPVSDVDRALAFYTENAGFTLDMDHVVQEGLRFVQLTPPGSACSIAIGEGLTDKPPARPRSRSSWTTPRPPTPSSPAAACP